MKRFLKYMIGMALLLTGSILAIKTIQAYQTKNEILDRIQTLQHCCFESLNGGQVFLDEFDPKKSTVLIYFHPECEHCQYEASEIGMQAGRFERANMILITPDDSFKRVEAFAISYHLWEVDNLTILLDRNNQFKKQFGNSPFPSVFIYGVDKKLVKMFKGETQTNAIINSIN